MSNCLLTEDEKAKLWGQFKLQLQGVFEPFNIYGLQAFIPGAIEEITELALQASKRYQGQDVPISHEKAKEKKRWRESKRGQK